MTFKLDDGTEPPAIERLDHCAHFYKSSLIQEVNIDVVEYRAGPVSSLTMTCTAGWETYGAECLMRVIAQRISEGYSVSSGSQNSAFLILKWDPSQWPKQIGRASCRESVCQYV